MFVMKSLLSVLVLTLPMTWPGEEALPTKDQAPKKIMCSYYVYGSQKFVCGQPPLQDLKERCSEQASRERGEKTVCDCTDNQDYIGTACD